MTEYTYTVASSTNPACTLFLDVPDFVTTQTLYCQHYRRFNKDKFATDLQAYVQWEVDRLVRQKLPVPMPEFLEYNVINPTAHAAKKFQYHDVRVTVPANHPTCRSKFFDRG